MVVPAAHEAGAWMEKLTALPVERFTVAVPWANIAASSVAIIFFNPVLFICTWKYVLPISDPSKK